MMSSREGIADNTDQEILLFGGKGGIFAAAKDKIQIRISDGGRILALAHWVRHDANIRNRNNFLTATLTSGAYACRFHLDVCGVRQLIGR